MKFFPTIQALACTLALGAALAQEDPHEEANAGFVPIFDGRSLANWRAEPVSQAVAWSVRDGVIRAEGQEDRLAYLVYSGDEQLEDFELRFRYRMVTDGNTGVEIRARPDKTGKRPFEGYHADLGHVGIGAGVLGAWDFHFGKDTREELPCRRGSRLVIDEDGKAEHQEIDGAVRLEDIKKRGWNDCRIVAVGRGCQFFINGKLASEFTDNIGDGHLASGLIALQLHDKGMIVEFKDIALKKLDASGKSQLPQGDGIAAGFKADTGISAHEAVIYANGFEQGDGEWKKAWDETRDDGGKVLALVAPPGGDVKFGGRSLQVTATLGENTGGGATQWFESSEAVFVRFYARFDAGCDYVHHFVTLRANKGLRGGDRWSGFGGAGLKPDGGERFSTALEPWGDWGKNPPPGRWNFYSYWHEMKASPDGKFWGNQFKPDAQPNIEKGKWICCEFMLKHNTPGQHDGEQAFWIDGELRGHWGGISWRTTPTLMANALTLESYITDRWTKNKTNTVYFDNLVIAKQYVGPTSTQGE